MLLLLTESRPFGISCASQLLDAGYLTRWARPDAGLALCHAFDTAGVLLDGRADAQPVSESICRALRSAYPAIPVALLLSPEAVADCPADWVIRAVNDAEIRQQVRAFCREACGLRVCMRTYALTVGEKPDDTRFWGYPISPAPRELRILRMLFYRAPQAVRADELLAACFPENTQRAVILPTLISRLNRRAHEAVGFPLIENVYGQGYRLRSVTVQPAIRPKGMPATERSDSTGRNRSVRSAAMVCGSAADA